METLQSLGQSIWYDNISRNLLDSGDLEALIYKGVSGVTSNPTIFERAIKISNVYDAVIQESTREDVEQLFFDLAVEDIRAAAKLLYSVYERTNGNDGFVSIEVSPLFAHDVDRTVQQAIELRDRIEQPNVMIKVPATEAGLVAIKQLIGEGVNVNVTLLFSLSMYEKVIDAYFEGLEKRIELGRVLQSVHSVASFFVSRVDQWVDQRLLSIGAPKSLLGKAAVANSRIAYELFKEKFNCERFETLAKQGANVQRLLWASTGVKNKTYLPLMYVTDLVGRDTVNTLPPNTLELVENFTDFRVTVSDELEEAQAHLLKLHKFAIDIELVASALLEQGIGSFVQSYYSLIQAIREKMLK